VGVDTVGLEKNKFMKGSGHIFYYLFNWNLSDIISNEKIHLILP